MRPSKRYGANKSSHARKFRRQVSHTKAVNISGMPMRGGIRL